MVPVSALASCDVRGRDGRERQEPLGDRDLGLPLEQAGAAGRDHDGVDDDRAAKGGQLGCDHLDDQRGREHAGLGRVDSDVVDNGPHLSAHEGRRDEVDLFHPGGVLGSQGGNRRHAVRAERRERLEVGLDAGATARVGAGDAE